MNYKASCPTCGTKLSRWQLFSTPSIYYRCRQCESRFRISALGLWVTLAILFVQLFWFLLCQWQAIAPRVAIGFLIVTCLFAIWWFPYLAPMLPVRSMGKKPS